MAERAQVTNIAPAGLVYAAEFISRDEELDLFERLAALEYEDVVMHGVTARRSVVHYGFNYGYETRGIQPTEPIPEWLHAIQARAAHYANLPDASLEQVLVARYPDGAGIGWHRDAPMFGEPVIGISLGDRGLMKFRRGEVGSWEVFPLWLVPRSLYIMRGAARYAWQHSLMPMKGQRYSITWRTVKHDYQGERRAAPRAAAHQPRTLCKFHCWLRMPCASGRTRVGFVKESAGAENPIVKGWLQISGYITCRDHITICGASSMHTFLPCPKTVYFQSPDSHHFLEQDQRSR